MAVSCDPGPPPRSSDGSPVPRAAKGPPPVASASRTCLHGSRLFGAPMIASLSATLPNRRSEIERLQQLVETFSEQHELPDGVVFAVNLALDEIVTNIIVHGYSDNQQHDIRVEIVLGEDAIEVVVRDDAPAFNPLLVPPVDLEAVAENRPRPRRSPRALGDGQRGLPPRRSR